MKKRKQPILIEFAGFKCHLVFRKYSNGRTAIELIEEREPYESVAVATVNLPDEPLEADETAIKNYSENEGMLECLVDAAVISKPTRYAISGFVRIPICKLLAEA